MKINNSADPNRSSGKGKLVEPPKPKLQNVLQDMTNMRGSTPVDLAALAAQYADELARWVTRVNSIENCSQKKHEEIASLSMRCRQLEEENALLYFQISKFNDAIDARITNLKSESKKGEEEKKELVRRLEAELKAATHESASLRYELQLLQNDVENMKANFQEMEAVNRQISDENSALFNQLHTVQEELERYIRANRKFIESVSEARPTLSRARLLIAQQFND